MGEAEKNYGQLTVRPIGGSIGAEIGNVDLSQPLSQAILDEIKAIWHRYHVIVFRDQLLSTAQHAAFCEQFGPLATYPFVEAATDHPNVIPIIKEAEQKRNFGGAWHTDSSYMEVPPKATCLYALAVPSRGGDTMFANTSMAFESLTPAMRSWVEKIVGVFTPALVHGSSGSLSKVKNHGKSMKKKDNPETAEQRVLHPIIRTHPVTGKKAIYSSIYHCERFDGMTREESLPVITFLHEQATKPDHTCRLRWENGTLALWDNRCVFHYALNDYDGERRHMHRVTIEGETPY